MNQGEWQLTAYIVDTNAEAEKVCGLSDSGLLKADETTHAYDVQLREAATKEHTPLVVTWPSHKEKKGGSETNTITHFLNSPSQTYSVLSISRCIHKIVKSDY
jgi:hypothetical protein